MFRLPDKSQSRRLFDRACALLAILIAAGYGFGLRIWALAGAAAGVSLLTEWICQYLRKKPFTQANLDAGLCGVILMLMMPATVSFSLLIMSCIFAIIIGRQLFGGRENPVVHPAAAGFCFALLNQHAQMTQFPKSYGILPMLHADAVTLTEGVSDAFNRGNGLAGHMTDWLIGLPNQPVGTGSVVLLCAVAAVLVLRRSASGWVTVPAVVFTVFCNLLFGYFRRPEMQLIGSFLANQFLFAVIFLHADPDYAPPQLAGSLYGIVLAGCTVILTRVLFVTDAPAALAVMLSPVALRLREMMAAAERDAQKGGARHAERTNPSAVPESGAH